MQKYLELLIELLRPDDDPNIVNMKKNYLAAWTKIGQRWDRSLEIFHKVWFIFSAYDELLPWKISLDEFLATGDITSNRKIFPNNRKSSLEVLHSIIDWKEAYTNTLIIFDLISFLTFSDNEKQVIQNRAKTNNNELIFC